MYILPSVGGGIFLPFKGEKKHIKHYILWYELFALHRYRGYPDFKVLILFMKESTEGVTDTLGHISKEFDKPYLSMEERMLRECPLDFSLVGQKYWKEGKAHV